MRILIEIKTPYGQGWHTKAILDGLSFRFSQHRIGWGGFVTFRHPQRFELGDEIAIRNENGDYLWCGQITERQQSSLAELYEYRAQGLSELFLDLPAPFTIPSTFSMDNYWRYFLNAILAQHGGRFIATQVHSYPQITEPPRLTRVADWYRLYDSLLPSILLPIHAGAGRFRMTLMNPQHPNSATYYPQAEYALPQSIQWELKEGLEEYASRLTLTPNKQQLLPQRTFHHPDWLLSIEPPPSVEAFFISEEGYLSPYALALRIQHIQDAFTLCRLRYRNKLPVARDALGNRLPHTAGIYARGLPGVNLRLRILVEGSVGADVPLTQYWQEIAVGVIPTVDEVTLEFQLVNPEYPSFSLATYQDWAVLDAPYWTTGIGALAELASPPAIELTNQAYPVQSGTWISKINRILAGSNPYDIQILNANFAPSIINKPARISYFDEVALAIHTAQGVVTQRLSTNTLRIQITDGDTTAVQPFAHIAIDDARTTNIDPQTESQLGIRYAQIELPTPDVTTADALGHYARPRRQLRILIPATALHDLPKVGQLIRSPADGETLTINEIEYAVEGGELAGLQLHCGDIELSLRAWMRRLGGARRFMR
jgi:hypothetical protein